MSLTVKFFVKEMIGNSYGTPMQLRAIDDHNNGWVNLFKSEGYDTREDAIDAIRGYFSYLDYQQQQETNTTTLSSEPHLVIIEKFGWN